MFSEVSALMLAEYEETESSVKFFCALYFLCVLS